MHSYTYRRILISFWWYKVCFAHQLITGYNFAKYFYHTIPLQVLSALETLDYYYLAISFLLCFRFSFIHSPFNLLATCTGILPLCYLIRLYLYLLYRLLSYGKAIEPTNTLMSRRWLYRETLSRKNRAFRLNVPSVIRTSPVVRNYGTMSCFRLARNLQTESAYNVPGRRSNGSTCRSSTIWNMVNVMQVASPLPLHLHCIMMMYIPTTR